MLLNRTLQDRQSPLTGKAIPIEQMPFYNYIAHVEAKLLRDIKDRDTKIEQLEKQVREMRDQWQSFLKELTLRAIRGE